MVLLRRAENGSGRDNAKTYLTENPDVFEDIYNKVMSAIMSNGNDDTADDEGGSSAFADTVNDTPLAEEKKASSRISIDVAVDD